MRTAELHKKDYEALKSHIISDIWFSIKDRRNMSLNIMEEKGIPAIVTVVIDDQESETIDELVVEGNSVIAFASCSGYGIESDGYNLDSFEVPMLVAILDSVEKHIELEDSK